jgi:hypothetical protein
LKSGKIYRDLRVIVVTNDFICMALPHRLGFAQLRADPALPEPNTRL